MARIVGVQSAISFSLHALHHLLHGSHHSNSSQLLDTLGCLQKSKEVSLKDVLAIVRVQSRRIECEVEGPGRFHKDMAGARPGQGLKE